MTRGKAKKNVVQKKGTLDRKHTEHIDSFEKTMASLPAKKEKLALLQRELALIKSGKSNRDVKGVTKIRRISVLTDSIAELQREINNIESCTAPLDYASSTLSLLIDYYNTPEGSMEGVSEDLIQECNQTDGTKRKNILSYLVSDFKSNKTVSNEKNRFNKALLFDDYLQVTDANYRRSRNKTANICPEPDCGGEMRLIQNDAYMVCEICSRSEPVLVITDKPNYKEPTQDAGAYAYKRINHLTEILSQLQAKESTDIPIEVFESIFRELKKQCINKDDLDIFRLRRILKKLQLNKFYEHVPHILQIINGKEPPNFSREDEMTIKKMFRDIQKPFAIYCPEGRKNFLNYSYVLHKFCELLGLDEYISYFPLLKNNSKLLQHDKIWKNICAYMKWEYYKSI